MPCMAQGARTSIQPGFNLFTVQQDIDIGKTQSALAEAQLPMLRDATIDAYLNRVISRLAAVAPGARYPYHIKAVNSADINAFSLPGGPMYVNRGLLIAASSEAELAGVLAHEMSHVALRHGTHQASTAQLASTGIGLLGGLLGRNSARTASVVNAVAGAGLNVAFLKFSRTAEYQADQTGAEIMARAGYNPVAMADFFEKLRAAQGRDPSKLAAFFSDHPPTADRESRIRTQARSLSVARGPDVGGLAAAQASLGRMPAAPTAAQAQAAASGRPQGGGTQPSPSTGPVAVNIPAASATMAQFRQSTGFYRISYPSNWRAYTASSGLGVSIVPPGGVVNTANNQQAILEGVIINHYAPFQNGGSGSLKDATDDLVNQIRQSNTYLQQQGPATVTSGGQGYSVRLAGTSPVTGAVEQLTVATRGLPDGHVIYVLGVAPGSQGAAFDAAFARMLQSLQVNDQAAHRN